MKDFEFAEKLYMSAEVLINARPNETRVAYIKNGALTNLKIEKKSSPSLVGSIYLGRVTRVLPGLQAAFVDIGLSQAAFLYAGDIREDIKTNKSLQSLEDKNPSPLTLKEPRPLDQEPDLKKEPRKLYSKIFSNNTVSVPPVETLIKEGDQVLVQITKDPLGTKGAKLTTHISLAGRFLVYTPTLHQLSVSLKIEQKEERKRLKDIILSLKPTGGVILRTASEGISHELLESDLDYLQHLWVGIYNAFKKTQPSQELHREVALELQTLRDLLSPDVEAIYVDDEESYKKVKKFIDQFLPRFKNKVLHYQQRQPLFDKYNLDHEISRFLDKKVWLKSGGYLIFDETEALVVVDINTGRFTGRQNFEETVLQTNLEAAKEIAYQLKIRNCGGIIVIDFIDMEELIHREAILDTLEQEFKSDPVRTYVLDMSDLGLVEINRKKNRPSLIKTLCKSCSYCNGKGYIKAPYTVASEIFRVIEREVSWKTKKTESVTVYCHQNVFDWVYADGSLALEYLEKHTGWSVNFEVETNYHLEQFEIK